ncbi:NUC185 domain-containing protein [Scheffersomyces xylosifermentans]|uniref:NUC185 domain-containing protein n=1 Tax=Scheffersomyces xylosifermentans TaxID=1304137 RepID=UPI00315CB088
MASEIETPNDYGNDLFVEPTTRSGYTPNIDEQNELFLKELLEPSNELSWDILKMVEDVPKVSKNDIYKQLLSFPERITRTEFRLERNAFSGAVEGYKEELRIDDLDNATAGNSMSINRKYTSKNESFRGDSSFLPFRPGGLIGETTKEEKKEAETLHRDEHGLYDHPPGLSRGLKVVYDEENDAINSLDVDDVDQDDEHDIILSEHKIDVEGRQHHVVGNVPFSAKEVEGLVPTDFKAMQRKAEGKKKKKKQEVWAHVVELDHKIENFEEMVPHLARTWPFELDTFQKEAVFHLENGDSVFVAAHTSAGKTVVAEYAIAMANRNMTKTIYTSPIKALSNQKFRDFKETFKEVDVGLITGDVQINPEANCLIMTTEILRSMLYRGADIIRDVEFVIFDEVHYVNDIDRGVVWEEVIIMLPDHIKFILLSATVPNTFEFANWVGRTKQKDIYVISTPKRPVPLEIFISAKDEMFKVVDASRKFDENEFKKHKEFLEKGSKKAGPPKTTMGSGSRGGPGGSARGGNRGGGRGGRGGQGGIGGSRGGQGGGRGNLTVRPGGRANFATDGPNKNTWLSLVQYLKKSNLLPAVVFVFSKKKCEMYADSLSSVDFCTAREKSEVHMFIDRAVSRLRKEDRELPQILKIREMLSRGIAVHHGGLLPIVKECIEILFAKSLVKVLFATETFAMGLNLPTRTVIFSSMRKHDGRGFRNLLPGEFTQMSGRAGRRGLDPTGTVIIMAYNDPISPLDFKEVTLGTPTKLQSQFRLTYNMILNLLRIEALRVEEMIKHSFSENSTQVLMPENQKKIEHLSTRLSRLTISDCKDCGMEGVDETFQLMKQYEEVYGKCIVAMHSLDSAFLKFQLLKTGRSVSYRDKNDILRIGFIVRSDSANSAIVVITFNHGKEYENDCEKYKMPFLPIHAYSYKHFKKIKYEEGLRVESVPYEKIGFICKYAIKTSILKVLENDTRTIREFGEQVKLLLHFQNEMEELAFSETGHITLHELVTEKASILKKLKESTAFYCPNFKQHFKEINNKDSIEKEIAKIQRMISDENLDLLPDYEQRLEVLRDLGYIDKHNNVVLKGRVACEVNSGWELMVTELVLDNFLGDFEPEEIVALLSCFVYEGRTNEEEPPLLTPRLEKGKERILHFASKLFKIYGEKSVIMTSEEEEFLERKRFALTNVVYEWARGLSFNEIMQISSEAEGTIVRVITRLDEICREVKNAALIVGDSTLHAKMGEAQERIKRDIVFCASLYL